MSTLRISNIEAKADSSSPTVDEQLRFTNSDGDLMLYLDGRTAGITTVGINTTNQTIKFDANNNVMVTGIITATEFHGALAVGTSVTYGDNEKAYFGTGLDLELFHNGTDSRIVNTTGDLSIRSNSLKLASTTGEEYFRGTANGSVDLFHDNVVKFTTNTDGYRSNDNVKAQFGNSSDLEIYHSGTNSVINNTEGALLFQTNGSSRVNLTDERFQILNRLLTSGDYNYLSGTSTSVATLTLKKSASGADSIDYLQLRDNSNALKFKISGDGILFTSDVLASHEGDTDTQIRFPSNDTIQFETAGNARLRITNNGRVGINSTSPTVPLDVVGSGKFSSALTVGGTLNASGTCTLGQTVSLNGTNPRLQFVDTNHDPDFSIYGNNARLVIYDDTNSAERLRINSSGVITLGTSTNTTLKAEICNSVSGHYFVSQCSDNNNGFEIYQQHGSTTTRNTLAVYNNSTGSKHLNFYVRGDNQVWISTVKNNTALVLDGTSSGTAYGETGGRIEFLMLNEVNQFTGNFAARISPYLQRGNNGFGLKFDVRHNASTTYKALDLTADYSVLPGLDNTITLGSSSYRWSNIYTADLHCSNEGSKNDVDGTWGDYTIQEGESDLFLINNRSGKKYKFNLTEVS